MMMSILKSGLPTTKTNKLCNNSLTMTKVWQQMCLLSTETVEKDTNKARIIHYHGTTTLTFWQSTRQQQHSATVLTVCHEVASCQLGCHTELTLSASLPLKHRHVHVHTHRYAHTKSFTLSMPAVPNCCCSKGSVSYWSNPPCLIFDTRALSKIKNGG